MATITGLTAARMLEIEAASIIDAEVVDGNLILIAHGGERINVGPISGPQGAPGPAGPAGISTIPGEVKLWPDEVLPELATYGKWVWADGAPYPISSYPIAASHISAEWRTFDGASDPGGSNFRVPDLRGLVPAGMDAMPGGGRANRMTRSVAITLAKKTGEEQHQLTVPEMPQHAHALNFHPNTNVGGFGFNIVDVAGTGAAEVGTHPNGGNQYHENVQPTVFVPYIVSLAG
jgi:microcystin-dependent protein